MRRTCGNWWTQWVELCLKSTLEVTCWWTYSASVCDDGGWASLSDCLSSAARSSLLSSAAESSLLSSPSGSSSLPSAAGSTLLSSTAGSSSLSSAHHTPSQSVKWSSVTQQLLNVWHSKCPEVLCGINTVIFLDEGRGYLASSCSPATPEEKAWTEASVSSCSPTISPHIFPTHYHEDKWKIIIEIIK